ncbi:hypothetical protein SLS58_002831 [Diplodia intermedia]|uniref:F-box domain-containing protein n=1 Tax=Diplodia intermedia TaxID=856260 RepID=A0ABR3TYE7_9PEZI
MPPTLDALPTELIHAITSHLLDPSPSTPALASLRLTSRALAAAASTAPAFRTLFATITADFACDAPSLRRLAAIAAHRDFGSCVRRIVLRTRYHDARRLRSGGGRVLRRVRGGDGEGEGMGFDGTQAAGEMVEAEREGRGGGGDAEVVERIFRDVAEGLREVVLEVAVFEAEEGERRPAWTVLKVAAAAAGEGGGHGEGGAGENEKVRLWKAMARDFGVVVKAMARAQTRVEVLSIYGGEWGGGVVAAEVGRAMDAVPRPALEACMARVKKISGFVSFGGLEDLSQELDGEGRENNFADRVGDFLGMAKELEELDLLHHESYRPTQEESSRALFQKMAVPIVGERIRSLRLRGFKVGAVDLLHLLQNAADLQELELHEIHLQDGKWSEVFSLLPAYDIPAV